VILAITVFVVPTSVVLGESCLDLGFQSAFVNLSIVDCSAMLLVAEGVDCFVTGKSDGLAFNGVGPAQNHHFTKRICGHVCVRWWYDSSP
jgi:hypothetical protein